MIFSNFVAALILVMLNIMMYYSLPYFFPAYLEPSDCKHVFSIRVENNVDADQMALSEAS